MRNASTMSARAADAEIIKRVRELLAQSESRQQGELALRISQVIRDVDAQRTADLTRIQKGLGSIDATVTAEAARHTRSDELRPDDVGETEIAGETVNCERFSR